MTDMTVNSALGEAPVQPAARPNLDKGFNPLTMILFFGILAAGLLFVAYSIYADVDATGTKVTTYLPYILLFVALLIALGFEFVNGFHDTANAVATVIYTHSLPAEFAVMWSGFFNFLGVLLSSGAVAFGIVSLLPVELILQVGSSAGFAMVFALLIAAIIWNLGTWYLGLPASSSHTLIGSIIGVGIANAVMHGRDGTSGVDWTKATEIGYALLLSPLFGFICAAVLLLLLKFIVRNPTLYTAPEGNKPPPLWIRGILIATCTGVSFAHGSNDGQKGMGLIMLILIGTVPTALCAQPRAAGIPGDAIPENLGCGCESGCRQGRRPQHHRQSAACRDAIRLYPQDQRGHLSLACRAGEGCRRSGRQIRLAQQGAGGSRRQHP
jgi:inorganic phosphate transporter, PiT family